MISSAIWKKHARVREVLKDLKIVFKRFFLLQISRETTLLLTNNVHGKIWAMYLQPTSCIAPSTLATLAV